MHSNRRPVPRKRHKRIRSSTADTRKNCAKCGKILKIGTNEVYNMTIKIRFGGILKIFCFCSYANMAASDNAFH